MLQNSYELNVLIKGKRPATEYMHNGQFFIEGRNGSNFELEFKNKTGSRVEAIFSVDGLSVTDGKEAGPQSVGYLVEPYGTLKIPGWTLSHQEIASFMFTGKQKSYSTQMTGSNRNNGVIGVMVFSEKPLYNFRRNTYPIPLSSADVTDRMMMYSSSNNIGGDITCASTSSYSSATGAATASTMNINNMAASSTEAKTKSLADTTEVQSLGTAFGKAQDFTTTTISFNRGDLISMMVLYYDDARGLKSRGIELIKPSRARMANQPQAFPGMGCQPPPDWKG